MPDHRDLPMNNNGSFNAKGYCHKKSIEGPKKTEFSNELKQPKMSSDVKNVPSVTGLKPPCKFVSQLDTVAVLDIALIGWWLASSSLLHRHHSPCTTRRCHLH